MNQLSCVYWTTDCAGIDCFGILQLLYFLVRSQDLLKNLHLLFLREWTLYTRGIRGYQTEIHFHVSNYRIGCQHGVRNANSGVWCKKNCNIHPFLLLTLEKGLFFLIYIHFLTLQFKLTNPFLEVVVLNCLRCDPS